MKGINRTEKGIEGIPLEQIMVAFLLATALPILAAGLENYTYVQVENNLRNEIRLIISTVKSVYTNSENNSRIISVNFDGSLSARIENVEIGDRPNGLCNSIRYKLRNREMKTMLITDPRIPVGNITSGGLDSLVLGEGRYDLLLIVKCELDLDQDGIHDAHVEVSRRG